MIAPIRRKIDKKEIIIETWCKLYKNKRQEKRKAGEREKDGE